jgi:hypothetical protein
MVQMAGVKGGMRNALRGGDSNMVLEDYELEWNLGKCAPWSLPALNVLPFPEEVTCG